MNASPGPRKQTGSLAAGGAEPPTVLIIDDLFGRTVAGGRNVERGNLCAQYLLHDITGDERALPGGQTHRRESIASPVPSAVADLLQVYTQGISRGCRRHAAAGV